MTGGPVMGPRSRRRHRSQIFPRYESEGQTLRYAEGCFVRPACRGCLQHGYDTNVPAPAAAQILCENLPLNGTWQ